MSPSNQIDTPVAISITASPFPEITYRLYDGTAEESLRLVEWFCGQLFPTLPPNFVRSRFLFVADPLLCLAERQGGAIAFKLAYRTTETILFSWLGGVLPEARRLGIASSLMQLQHEDAQNAGYKQIETRTRTSNNAMIMLNLRYGFEIVGLEADAYGRFVVIQRKTLG